MTGRAALSSGRMSSATTSTPEPRIEPLDVQSDPADLQEMFDEARLDLIGKRNFFRTLAHHPRLLEGYLSFINGLRSGLLPPRDRELVTIRVAAACGCDYVVHQHVPRGLKVGLSAEEVERISADRPESGAWSDHDRTLLAAIDELMTVHRVSDATWAALAGDYSDAQMLEFVFAVGRVVMASGFLNSVQVPFEDVA